MNVPVTREQKALQAQQMLGESLGLGLAAERVLEMAKASFGSYDDKIAKVLREASVQLKDQAARYKAKYDVYVSENGILRGEVPE